jgi:hypothetical protein
LNTQEEDQVDEDEKELNHGTHGMQGKKISVFFRVYLWLISAYRWPK